MWDVRYRPVRFTDVLGQDGAVGVLKARLAKGTILDTSYIFSGGHGQGKTTLARILGRAILCQRLTSECEPCNECENCVDALNENSAALSEMNAADHGTIEHAREIVKQLSFVVAGAAKRIYILDESHRMSRDAQDVLLKPIEDKRMVGIFCTTEPEKIRGPIRSRCEEHQIRKITREDVLKRMKWILEQEKVEHEDDAVLIVIDHSKGHVRDIVNQLEMIAQLGPITTEAVREHLKLSVVSTYYQILLSLSTPAIAVRLAEEACEHVGPEEVSEGLAEAAMSSYRLAHGMFAEFTFVDRELATKVHGLYGDAVLKFSEYFLQIYKPTRMRLLSSIIACAGGLPAASSTAPVTIQVSAPAVQTKAAEPVQDVSPVVAPPAAKTPSVPPPVPAPAPTQPVVAESRNGRRADGVGNLGSGDSGALTSLDEKGVPLNHPRGREAGKTAIPHGPKETFLTPEEFRQKFALRCAVISPAKAGA